MEETPESQYHALRTVPKTPAPDRWQVGDLCRFPAGLVLCVGDGSGSAPAQFVTDGRNILADIDEVLDGGSRSEYLLHNTGLRYTYTSYTRLLIDVANGRFTPEFEILLLRSGVLSGPRI